MNRFVLASLLFAAAIPQTAVSQVAFQPAVPITVPGLAGPRGCAAGDLDGDRDADLAVAFATSNAVGILTNDGSGNFTLLTSINVGAGPRAVVLADLDGDGDMDAATADETSSTVSVVWNGGAAWSAGPLLPCGVGPRFVHAADVDMNGTMDLVCSNTAGNTISVILNQSGGAFAPTVSYPAGASPREIGSGDFDSDGDLDLVVASANTNQILLFAGAGNGTFGPTAGTTSTGALAVGLATGDVDGDGDLDVVSSNFLAPSLTIYANGGAASFVTSSVSIGTHFQDVVLADFDFDGDLDAAGLDAAFNHVRVAENVGGGFFSGGQQVPVGASTSTMIAADVDGDFIPDVVTADSGAGLSLLRNALPGPVMGPAASGNTPDGAGGLFDALLIDGSAGGAPRRVDVALGSSIAIQVQSPPLATIPARFLLWGTFGAPTPAMETSLPFGFGAVAFAPFHLDPFNPNLFVLANGFFQDPAALITPPPAPWAVSIVLPQFPITVAVQGITEDAGGLRVTNGIILQMQ